MTLTAAKPLRVRGHGRIGIEPLDEATLIMAGEAVARGFETLALGGVRNKRWRSWIESSFIKFTKVSSVGRVKPSRLFAFFS